MGKRFLCALCIVTACFSNVFGAEWMEATPSAPWMARYGHGGVAFDGRLWVLGGSGSDSSRLNDVWYSSDGANWQLATANAPWLPRVAMCSAVHDGKMWVLGGLGTGEVWLNDVWWSEDGVNWTEATAHASWSGRYNRACESFNGKMWMLGGRTAGGYVSDVWSSIDGASWTLENSAPGFPRSPGHGAVVLNDKMYLMGGGFGDDRNDVYVSEDGATWSLLTADSGWEPRHYPEPVAYSNQIWVMGGFYSSLSHFNDVWQSVDGLNWIESATSPAPWLPRTDHRALVLDGKIWVVGGFSEPGRIFLNDVWYLGEPSTPSIAAVIDIKPGSYPNSINLESHGVIPVAILSTDDFDATTVDPDTVELAGSTVAIRGNGKRPLASIEDVDGDGWLDLMLHVETENLMLETGATEAVLTGETYDGALIQGSDSIVIVNE